MATHSHIRIAMAIRSIIYYGIADGGPNVGGPHPKNTQNSPWAHTQGSGKYWENTANFLWADKFVFSFHVSTFEGGRIVNFEHEKQLYCPPVRYNYVNVSAALDTKMGHVLLYSDLKGNMMYNLKMYL